MHKITVITLSFILFSILTAPMKQCLKINQSIDYKYDVMYSMALIESGGNSQAVNKKSGAIGLFQILPGDNGGLAHYNTFSKGKKYTKNDLFNKSKNIIIANWINTQNMKYFNSCRVQAVNSFNMGIANTIKGKFYFQYCTNILGYYIVSNFLNDYYVTNKSTNKKEWYIIKKELYNRLKN